MRLKFPAPGLSLAIAFSFLLSGAHAQGRQEEASKTWAVIIGVSRYQKLPGGQQLQFAESDAVAFAESLKKAGTSPSNIRLLVGADATIASIRSAIGNWLARSASERDTVYIFFSGHGWAEREFNEAYLLAHDSDTANPYGTALSVGDIKSALAGRVRAHRVLIIADPIRRDLFPDDDRPASTAIFAGAFNQLVSARPGIAAILGSGPGEFAREGRAWGGQGIFTKSLIEAILGSADSNNDAIISATEVFDHVSARVATETSDKQHPWRAGVLAPELVLARIAPPPSAPQTPQPGTRAAEAATEPGGPARATATAVTRPDPSSPGEKPAPEKAVSKNATGPEQKPQPREPSPGASSSQSVSKADDLIAKARPGNPEPTKPEPANAEPAKPEPVKSEAEKIATAKPETVIAPPPAPKLAPAPPVTSSVGPASVRGRVEPVTTGLPKIEATAAPSPLSLQVEAAIASSRLIGLRGDSAWELYQKLAQEQPSSPETGRLRPMLAEALDKSGRAIIGGDVTADNVSEKVDEFKRAGQMFARARTLMPGDAKIADMEKLSAAQALLALQFFEEAERSLSQIQGDRSAFLENTLGLIYAGRLDSFRAERAFKRAAEMKPDWAIPLYNLAILYRQDKNEAALETLERAASLEPRNAAILQALGDEYFGREKWQQAVDTFRKAVAIRPEDDALHTKLGHALYSLGQRDEANKEYQKAQELRNRKN